MKVKIYQVNTQRDKNKVKFLGLDQIRKYQGTENVDATLYDEVFSGDVACKNPEDVPSPTTKKFPTITYVKFYPH